MLQNFLSGEGVLLSQMMALTPRARPRPAQGLARPGKASQPPGRRPPGHRARRVALCPPAPAPRSSPGGSMLEAGVIPLPCCPGASCAGRRAPG